MTEFEEIASLIEQDYRAGNGVALLRMLRLCADDQQPIPEWARMELRAILSLAEHGEIGSWDDVFGQPWPKGRQRRGIQTDARMWEVHTRVRKLHENEGLPIDNELFERVANDIGMGRTTVGKLYGCVERARRRVREED